MDSLRCKPWGGPARGLRCRIAGEPVEPDPVSTGVGSRCLIRKIRLIMALTAAAWLGGAAHAADTPPAGDALEEIIISASLRSTPLRELPQSATVLDSQALDTAGVQHFED